MAAEAGGCFPGDATVRLDTGQRKTMDNVTVGDRVMTYDALMEHFHYDPVIMFLHRSRLTAQMTQYVTVETEYGHHLTLTPGRPYRPYLHSSSVPLVLIRQWR